MTPEMSARWQSASQGMAKMGSHFPGSARPVGMPMGLQSAQSNQSSTAHGYSPLLGTDPSIFVAYREEEWKLRHPDRHDSLK